MQQGWIGKTLAGRYHIDDLVGHGGMSSVYKASDSNLKRVVAIKLIHEHLTGDGEFLRRFETEAEAIAQLRHSNIIQVFDFNHEEGHYYMVMEFVAGESLQARLKRLNESGRRLNVEEAIKIAASVCDGVDYAHKRGMIHRDIKPANIMLSVHGDAILTDFGLAKIAGTTQHTAAGAVMGTALYMSPEQIRGEQVDARTDIYAMGVTLFEMLSGKPPYVADSAMTVLMMHLNDPLPDLRELNPDVPEDIVEVIRKALAKDPNERYGSAAEMAADLRALADKPKRAVAAAPPADEPPVDATVVARPGDTGGIAPPASPPETTAVHRREPEPATPAGGAAGPPPPIPPVADRAGEGRGGVPPWAFAVAGVAVVAIVVIVLLVAGVFSGGDDDGSVAVAGTSTPSATAAADGSPTTGATAEPTQAPTPTPLPDGHVRINGITLDGQTYIVEYETAGYTEAEGSTHVHFFFDTVPPEEAGRPADGPWYVWYGPRPFNGYTVPDRPPGATAMCALTANADHSVNLGTGNCVPLPDA